MNHDNFPFKALIVGPTKPGKTRYLGNFLSTTFYEKFDYVILLCPTFIHNKTCDGSTENDKDLLVLTPLQGWIDDCLKIIIDVYKGTNTLIIFDDCAASRDVKRRTNKLVNLAFRGRHMRISVWVLMQQMTSIAKPFRENPVALVIFYTPSAKDTTIIFEDHAGELIKEEQKEVIAKLKRAKYSHLIFSPRHAFSLSFEIKFIKWTLVKRTL